MHKETFEKKIIDIVEKVAKEFQPDKVILFGSWAWGEPSKDSDVDLFIIKDTDNPRALARKIDSFVFPRYFPLDLIVYKPEQLEKRKQMGDFFIQNILTKGKVLYAK